MTFLLDRDVRRVSLLTALLLAIFGCSQKEPSTPREAMVQFVEGMHAGNESKLFTAVDASPAQQDFLRATRDFLTAISDFRDAFTSAYGQQAWRDFQDESKGPQDGNAHFSIPDAAVAVAKYQAAAIDQRGGEAFCPNLDEPGKTIRIVQVGSRWRVDGNTVCPTAVEMQQKMAQVKPLTDVIRKYQPAIGQPGITPEDIDAELGRAMMKVLRGLETPAPHRFNVDKLSGDRAMSAMFAPGPLEIVILLLIAALSIGLPVIAILVVLFLVRRSRRPGSPDELTELRAEVARLRDELERLKKGTA